MWKIAEKIIDVTDDISKKYLKSVLPADSAALDIFKKIRILDAKELEILPDDDFALVFIENGGDKIRKFPIPDEGHALVSALYLAKRAKKLPVRAACVAAHFIDQALENACDRFPSAIVAPARSGIRDLIRLGKDVRSNVYHESQFNLEDELRKQRDDVLKTEKISRAKQADEDFAFVVEEQGRKHRLFPIHTEELVKKAEQYFDLNYKLFTPDQRHGFSKSVSKKAGVLGVKLASANLRKYYSDHWAPTATDAVTSRINYLKDRNYRLADADRGVKIAFKDGAEGMQAITAYMKLRDRAGTMNIHKYAKSMSLLDKATGLDSMYGKHMYDPYESTYHWGTSVGTEKTAAGKYFEFGGNRVPVSALKSLNIGDLSGLVDDDLLDEIKEDPVPVFKSLPTPYKSAIMDAMLTKTKK